MDITTHPKNPNKAIATYANLDEEFVFYKLGLPMSRSAAHRTLLGFNIRSSLIAGSYYPHQVAVKMKNLRIAESTLENLKETFSETDDPEEIDTNESTLEFAYHEVLETITSFLTKRSLGEEAPDLSK